MVVSDSDTFFIVICISVGTLVPTYLFSTSSLSSATASSISSVVYLAANSGGTSVAALSAQPVPVLIYVVYICCCLYCTIEYTSVYSLPLSSQVSVESLHLVTLSALHAANCSHYAVAAPTTNQTGTLPVVSAPRHFLVYALSANAPLAS